VRLRHASVGQRANPKSEIASTLECPAPPMPASALDLRLMPSLWAGTNDPQRSTPDLTREILVARRLVSTYIFQPRGRRCWFKRKTALPAIRNGCENRRQDRRPVLGNDLVRTRVSLLHALPSPPALCLLARPAVPAAQQDDILDLLCQ
jgi:hypothetical protein